MKKLLSLFLILIALSSFAQDKIPQILSMKDRAATIDRLLLDKVETTLPELMRREGIDMWVVMAREYNEDPVIRTLLPATWLAARRRTILVMYDQGADKGIECMAVARYDVGEVFKKSWDKEKEPDQWKRLIEIIEERNPSKIGINKSVYFAQADGLTATEYEAFMENLPKKYHEKVASAEPLAVGWLETRTPAEMAVYQQIVKIAHEIIAEGFSDRVIQPGVTTTDDVVWWYRDRIRELKLITWFHPSVSIQRADAKEFDHVKTFSNGFKNDNVIMPGDLLHVDFGITYLRLNTDTQQHAYILRPGEKDAPEYLKQALRNGNRLQDIFTGNFKEGKNWEPGAGGVKENGDR